MIEYDFKQSRISGINFITILFTILLIVSIVLGAIWLLKIIAVSFIVLEYYKKYNSIGYKTFVNKKYGGRYFKRFNIKKR